MHTYETSNIYNVTLTGRNAKCADAVYSQTITIESYPEVDLGPDTSICEGITGSILLSNQANPAGIYTWSTGQNSNSISVNKAGYYWVEASSVFGACKTSDSIWIKRDCYMNIPNSFSPNGDGLNDYFIPRELLISGIVSFTMTLYNRWGENIFSTTTTDGRGWDGKWNDIEQPVGVYVYVINAQFRNGLKKEFTGNVTLMR